jgi:hypothetical protein
MDTLKIQKPYHGQKCGCSDTELVSPTDQYRFSRILDAMFNAQVAGYDPHKIFDLLDVNDKLKMNYGNWKYYASTEK